MNLLISKKRTSLPRSTSAIFSCWILWILVEVQQVLIPSWRHTKLQRQKDSFFTNSLITPTNCRIQKFPLMMLSTLNCAAATLSKPHTQTMSTYWKGDCPQNKPLSDWNCKSHPLLELRFIITCNSLCKQEQMSSFRDFLRWYNNKDVLPTLEAMQKMIASYHDKDIDMLKLGCTLPNLAKICLHKSTDAKFYPSTEADKHLLEKKSRRRRWWPIYRFYTHSICWWNFYPKVYKHMQIFCWDWCQPTIPLLDASTHAHRSLYALGYRIRNQ